MTKAGPQARRKTSGRAVVAPALMNEASADQGSFHAAAMYGITRYRRGYWKVVLERNGVTLAKSFPFLVHGSEEAALLHAQAWRDEIVRTHPPMSRRKRAEIPMSTNTSGVPGVQCILRPDGRPEAWTARTKIGPGQVLRKYFSVTRYGAQARSMAIAERKKQLQQMEGVVIVHPSEVLVRTAPQRTLPLDCPAPLAVREVVRSNNKSGVAGVFFHRSYPTHSGEWIATTYARNRKYLRNHFSVREYGEPEAKALAVAARQKQLELMAGQRSRETTKKATKRERSS